MARRKPYKNITIHPAQGGALIGSASDDVPLTKSTNFLSSSANYTEKLNFRRETDGELRREGWELFNPRDTPSEAASWGNNITFNALDSQYPVRALHQFQGRDGTPILIAIAGPKVWRLHSEGSAVFAKDYNNPGTKYATDAEGNEYWKEASNDFFWENIYTFSHHMDAVDVNGETLAPEDGGAYRWEVVDVQNHLVINNGVDLPIVYESHYEQAVPLYGLRENGVVACGTISVFQDRLFCADLTVIVDGYEQLFTKSENPYGYIYTDPLYGQVKAQRFQYRMIHSAEGEPKLFNSGIVSGDSVVMESGGLPGTLTVGSTGRYEFVPSYNYALFGDGSMYQEYSFGTFQGDDAYTLNMVSPISTIKTVNEDPTSLEISGIFLTTYDSNTLPSTLPLTLGGDVNAGFKLVDDNRNDLILLDPSTGETIAEGNYDIVLRPYAEQLRSPASVREFSQDGSRILKMEILSDKLVVYRDTGYFFISKSNTPELPFSIEPRYKGGRTADFRHTVTLIDGNKHIFMGNTGIYQIDRTSSEPQPVKIFEVGPPFWHYVPANLTEYVFTEDNPVTREVFINCPVGFMQNSVGSYIDAKNKVVDNPELNWSVIAYDYIQETLSTIDASFTAGAYIRKPRHNRLGPEETWFIMGVHQAGVDDRMYIGTQYRLDQNYGGVIARYGYGPPSPGTNQPYRLYNRLGYGYLSRIKSGLIDFGDSFADKELRSYVLELSSKYDTTPVKVRISKTSAPQGIEEVETMEVVDGEERDYVILNDIVEENMIPIYARSSYFRDELTVEPIYENKNAYADINYVYDQTSYAEGDLPTVLSNPVKLVGRTFEVSGIDTRATTQAYNQG